MQLVGSGLGIIVATTASYFIVTVLAFNYLDSSAASLVMTALLPLATVPLILKTMVTVDETAESGARLEESNHVI